MHFPRNLLVAVLASASLFVGGPANGAVYDNGTPDFAGALFADVDGATMAGDEFTVPQAGAIVTHVRFWGGYLGGDPAAADSFTLRLHSAVQYAQIYLERTIGAAELARSAQPVGFWNAVDAFGNALAVPVYEYVAAAAFAPVAGLGYLLSIQNDTSGSAGAWFWSTSNGMDGSAASRQLPGWWQAADVELAFQLLGPGEAPGGRPLPEPGTLALLAFGWLGLARLRRR